MKKGGNIKSYKRQYKSKTKRTNLTLTNDKYHDFLAHAKTPKSPPTSSVLP
jgi:hypothetical protein